MARQIKGLPLLPPWSRKEVVALLLFWSWARAGIRTHIAKQYSWQSTAYWQGAVSWHILADGDTEFKEWQGG